MFVKVLVSKITFGPFDFYRLQVKAIDVTEDKKRKKWEHCLDIFIKCHIFILFCVTADAVKVDYTHGWGFTSSQKDYAIVKPVVL